MCTISFISLSPSSSRVESIVCVGMSRYTRDMHVRVLSMFLSFDNKCRVYGKNEIARVFFASKIRKSEQSELRINFQCHRYENICEGHRLADVLGNETWTPWEHWSLVREKGVFSMTWRASAGSLNALDSNTSSQTFFNLVSDHTLLFFLVTCFLASRNRNRSCLLSLQLYSF